jgi:ribosomal protein S18 acetylase RimI-like enzyme
MCGSEECKRKARERASKNYIGKHGKIYSINDPEQQAKMIYGRKTSGTYIFEDEDTGKKYRAMYDSSYGRDFLEMIDTFLFWSGADIIAPSPHVYYYEYEGQKHFYIPDVYISSLNLEVELKDGGDNPNMHPKIQAVDKVKEKAKDEVMESIKDQVNYIKICNKDYAEFFALLSRLKEQDVCPLPKWEKKLEPTMDSYAPTDVDWSTYFGSYHIDEYEVKGGVDEEQFSKTLDDEIKLMLNQIVPGLEYEHKVEKPNADYHFFVYAMGRNYTTVLLGKITVWVEGFWDSKDPKYYFEWDYQEEVELDDLDPEFVTIQEGSEGIIGKINGKVNLVKRNQLLNDPMINYDTLLLYYRKKLFHQRLTDVEWMSIHMELQNVQIILKGTINGSNENDERMKYEAKKALKEVNRFLEYMDATAPDQKPVKESYGVDDYPVMGAILTEAITHKPTNGVYDYTTDPNQMLDIVMTLSDKEREYIGRSNPPYENYWKNTVFYREVMVVSGIPVAFIEVYRHPQMRDTAHIVVATRAGDEYRRSGYATILIKRFMKSKKPSWAKRIEYGFDKGNDKSEALAKSLGFKDPVKTKDGGTQMFLPVDESAGIIEPSLEAYLISKGDIQCNMEEWKHEAGKNILLITGLSGSGKTSTGYELAYDYKAEVFQLDWISQPEHMANSPETPNYGLWQDISKKFGPRLKTSNTLNGDNFHNLVIDVFEEIVRYANKNPNLLFIVEGVQIPGHLHDYPDIEKFPIIIKGTSVATSMFRRFKRDSLKDALRTGDTNILKYYLDHEKHLNWFRGQVTESALLETSVTSELKPDYKSLGHRNLSSFRREYLTPEAIKKYKDQSSGLCHVKIEGTSGYIWTYHGEVVGYLNVEHKDDGTSWIQAFEINPNYRGYGLSHQMLLIAVNDFDARYLSVAKSNKIAQKVYKERGFKVYKETPAMLFMTLNKDTPVEESTYIEASKDGGRYYPVFIFLSYTGTNVAKLIKAFTHDPYAHSSLSFDTDLENMVSFNGDGMVDENIRKDIYKKNSAHIRYSLYMYMATASEYDSMRNFVDELLGKRNKLKYNVLGLTNFIFGRGSSREDKYFCSEFIASVISAGNDKLLDRQPYMISPYYFAKNKNFIFIKTGILKNYDPKIVDKLVAEKLEEGGFENVVIKQ